MNHEVRVDASDRPVDYGGVSDSSPQRICSSDDGRTLEKLRSVQWIWQEDEHLADASVVR